MELFEYTELAAEITNELCIKPIELIKESLDKVVEHYNTNDNKLPLLVKLDDCDLIVEHQKSPRFLNTGELVPEYIEVDRHKFTETELTTIKNQVNELEKSRNITYSIINHIQNYCVEFTIFALQNDVIKSPNVLFTLFKKTFPENILNDSALLNTVNFKALNNLTELTDEDTLVKVEKLKTHLNTTDCDLLHYQPIQDMYNLRLLFNIN